MCIRDRQSTGQPFLYGVKELIDEILLDSDVPCQEIRDEAVRELMLFVKDTNHFPVSYTHLDVYKRQLQEVQSNLDTGEFLVFEEDGVITACVYVKMQGQRSYLGLLPVDPKAQKSGSGSKVMNAAEDHCRNAGSRFMDIRLSLIHI